MIRRQPISTHTDTPCPTRRASDLRCPRRRHFRGGRPWHGAAALYLCGPAGREDQRFRLTGGRNKIRMEAPCGPLFVLGRTWRSEEHTSELQSLMRHSYAAFCLTQQNNQASHLTIILSKSYD